MSYRITVYCDDPTIKKINFTVTQAGNYSCSYSPGGEYSQSGFSDDWTATFTAEPASGCSFVKWEYWRGSKSGSPYSSYSEKFTFAGGQDLYVRAVGQRDDEPDEPDTPDAPDSPWNATSTFTLRDPNYVTEGYYCFVDLSEYQLHYGTVRFSQSGHVHLYSVGNIDTIGFLCDYDTFQLKDDWSEPEDYCIIEYDDASGTNNNFDIRCEVEANKDYVLVVRGATGVETGSVRISVSEVWSLRTLSYGTLSGTKSESIICPPYTMFRRSVKFSKSGTVTISMSGPTWVALYLSTSTDWAYGTPTEDCPQSEGCDASLTTAVKANTQYYIWFQSLEIYPSEAMTVSVSDVAAAAPEQWIWTASNGSASSTQTYAARKALRDKTETTNFSHLVWNDLVDKAGEYLAYTEKGSWTIGSNNYGYPKSTTYMSLLENAKIFEDDLKLYAYKFNILRFCIGVMATFNNAAENNAIYQHYADTGSWDMAEGEDVLGEYILALASKMNQI